MTDAPGNELWLWIASSISAALVLAALIVQYWPAERTWLTAFVVYAPKIGWVAIPIVPLVWSVWARDPWAGLLNLGIWLIAVFALAGLQLPLRAPAATGGDAIRVATWNVHEEAASVNELAETIAAWDCDLVYVQEVGEVELEGLLTGYEHLRTGDMAIFVRGEILDTEVIPTGHENLRPVVAHEVRIDGKRLKLLHMHVSMSDDEEGVFNRESPLSQYLPKSIRARHMQFDRFLRAIPEDMPIIAAGDFNVPPNSMFYRRFRRRLTDVFASVGLGFGYTYVLRGVPVLRIDYVWTGNGCRPLACRLGKAGLSDHRPVIAEVGVPGRMVSPAVRMGRADSHQ